MAAISKAEYLKRYLSTSADEDKKKKRKKKPKAPQKFARSVIVDDDVSWKDLRPKDEESTVKEEKFENAGDEAPVVYDEDGIEAISLDVYKKREDDQKSKWAPLNSNNEAEGQEKVRSSSPNRNLSPVRRSRADTPDNSPPRNRNHGSPDLSPSRDKIKSLKKRPKEPLSRGEDSRHLSSEKDSRADFSLGAKRSRHDSPELTPPRARGQRHDSPDTSPIRQLRHESPDQSPTRRRRHDSPDLSPDRGIKASNSDHSPPRRHRHDSSDLSPPRGTKGNDSDQSPPRRQRHNSSDLSPPRGTKGSDSDQSPPRRRHQHSPDLSPPRNRKAGRGSDLSPPRQRSSTSTDKDRKAGLLSAEDLKRENALTRKREDEMFAKMDSRKSGKDAKTVHRDKSGKIRDLEAEEQKKKEDDRKKAIHDEKFKKWGKGIVQTQEAQKKMEDYLHEVNKPLARYKDDKDLDAMLKEQEREDDPMLAYMQKKKSVVKKKAGVKERPTYKGPTPPPNRFRIPPGYRWDGVDRSNGFENKRFAMLANKKATEKMAHKWSVEEM